MMFKDKIGHRYSVNIGARSHLVAKILYHLHTMPVDPVRREELMRIAVYLMSPAISRHTLPKNITDPTLFHGGKKNAVIAFEDLLDAANEVDAMPDPKRPWDGFYYRLNR
jgi:hypothetical protein